MYTLHQARQEKIDNAPYCRQEEIDLILANHPEIGILMVKGKPAYYTCHNVGSELVVTKANHPRELI